MSLWTLVIADGGFCCECKGPGAVDSDRLFPIQTETTTGSRSTAAAQGNEEDGGTFWSNKGMFVCTVGDAWGCCLAGRCGTVLGQSGNETLGVPELCCCRSCAKRNVRERHVLTAEKKESYCFRQFIRACLRQLRSFRKADSYDGACVHCGALARIERVEVSCSPSASRNGILGELNVWTNVIDQRWLPRGVVGLFGQIDHGVSINHWFRRSRGVKWHRGRYLENGR